MNDEASPAPRDAATVLLVRDGADGVEVFMVVRHRAMDFAAGAMVFPGGAVESGDRDVALRERIPAGERAMPAVELATRAAAIREAYEESGVLLARAAGATRLVDRTRLSAIAERHATERREHRIALPAFVETENLELAVDLLTPFAHWITPTILPKRFDTLFYLAAVPAGQVATHDGREAVESQWLTPAAACALVDTGQARMMFATRMNLERLGRGRNVAQAMAQARATRLVTVTPELCPGVGERRLSIPASAGYGATAVTVDAQGRMLVRE